MLTLLQSKLRNWVLCEVRREKGRAMLLVETWSHEKHKNNLNEALVDTVRKNSAHMKDKSFWLSLVTF